MKAPAAPYLVKLPDGSLVASFARYRNTPIPMHRKLSTTRDHMLAQRMPFNVAQAVAHANNGIVITA